MCFRKFREPKMFKNRSPDRLWGCFLNQTASKNHARLVGDLRIVRKPPNWTQIDLKIYRKTLIGVALVSLGPLATRPFAIPTNTDAEGAEPQAIALIYTYHKWPAVRRCTSQAAGRLCLRFIRTASPVAPFIDARMRVALCLCRGVPRDRVSPIAARAHHPLPSITDAAFTALARRCDRDARSDHTNRHQRLSGGPTTPRTAIGRVWRRRRRARPPRRRR